MRIVSITDSDTANGLKLAGIKEAYETESQEEAEEFVDQILESKEVGIIIITEDLAKKLGDRVFEIREEREGITPVVIKIPGKEGPVPERREVIDKLVKRAVGIKIEEQ